MKNESKFIQSINECLDNEDYYLLDSIFKEYLSIEEEKALILIKTTFKTKLFEEKEILMAHNFSNYWMILSEFYEKLENVQREEILESIKCLQSWNNENRRDFIKILEKESELYSEEKKVKLYLDYSKNFLSRNYFLEKIENEYIKCVWFILQMDGNRSIYLNKLESVSFDFTEELFVELIKKLNERESDIYHDFDFLMEHTSWNLMAYVLKKSTLMYQGTTEYSEEFCSNKVIQKIIINLDMQNEWDNTTTLQRIIENLDLDNKFLGFQFNDFVKKHQIVTNQPEGYYVDAIGPAVTGWVSEQPFFKVSHLYNNLDVKELLRKLKETIGKDKTYLEENYFKPISIEGQKKELLKVFLEEKIWEANSSEVISFINGLVSDKSLFSFYDDTVFNILTYGIENEFISDNCVCGILMKMDIGNDDISINLSKLMSKLVKMSEHEDDRIYEILFTKIEGENLSANSAIERDTDGTFVDLNEFINTSLGRYVSVLKDIPKTIFFDIFRGKILPFVENCHPPYKEYLIGSFLPSLTEDDLEDSTINRFLGFSHNFILSRTSNWVDYFEKNAEELFVSGYSDHYSINNLTLILISKIDPFTKKFDGNVSREYKEQILVKMFQYYKELNDVTDVHIIEWLKWFLGQGEYFDTLLKQLLLSFEEMDLDKIRVLENLIDVHAKKDGVKKDEYLLYNIYELEKFSDSQIKELINLVLVLLKKELANVNYYFVHGIDQICKELSVRQSEQVIESVLQRIQPFILESDFELLKNKYLPK
ncbi:hypothetical protein [Enterococcus faecalis]|uniref:hypothetical protein n=1 Tax=Enterococcus faecalis TaxID=1351 RepID=UPI00115A66EB|nr:hypothetical protein [Enterococcus faecalis]